MTLVRRRVLSGIFGLLLPLAAALLAGCDRPPAAAPATTPAGASARREVRVAAASDLKFAMEELSAAFARRQPGVALSFTYGSSGNFFTQLKNDAPFDLFLSADVAYPQQLVEQGKAARDTLFRYGVGRIVVWVPNNSGVDVRSQGLGALTSPAVRTIAIANPRHAPYGRAAEAALKSAGVYDKVKDRLVLGENISQAAQFVQSGAADAGVIALSLAVSPGMRAAGRYAEVPPGTYPPIEQGGVIMNAAGDRAAAQDFRKFLLGAEGQAVLTAYGFSPAPG